MTEFKSFVNDDISLKRWHLYTLRFALLVFGWTALKLGFLALMTDASTGVFVWPAFGLGMAVAIAVSIAVYGLETNSIRAKISILVLFVVLAIVLVADRIRTY